MEAQDKKVVYAFPRGQGEEVQVAITKYKGKYYIDLRQWFQDEETKTLIPTKKGVFIPLECATELKKAVDRTIKLCERLNGKKEGIAFEDTL